MKMTGIGMAAQDPGTGEGKCHAFWLRIDPVGKIIHRKITFVEKCRLYSCINLLDGDKKCG